MDEATRKMKCRDRRAAGDRDIVAGRRAGRVSTLRGQLDLTYRGARYQIETDGEHVEGARTGSSRSVLEALSPGSYHDMLMTEW